jgi:hypothetical protein
VRERSTVKALSCFLHDRLRARWGTSFVSSLTLALFLVTNSSPVAAESDKDVDAVIKKAVGLRREGKDREALAELQQASASGKQPRLSVQIGLAEQALGLWVAAERDLKEGLAHPTDTWIKKNRRALDESLGFIVNHLATLDVWGTPEGAEVSVNGESLGALPLAGPQRVPGESLRLVVKAKGFESLTKTLEMKPGDNLREHVVLTSVELAPPPLVAQEPPAPGLLLKAPVQPDKAEKSDEGGSVFGTWWFWTVAGVLVAGGATAVFLATRKSDSPACVPSGTTTCSQW